MMNNILSIGKSGLKSNQFKMDSIADNIANVSTNGYKNKEVAFQELLNNDEINVGSKGSLSKIDFSQGTLVESPYQYNMAISGNGFFGVIGENDALLLTRNGGFHMNEDMSITDDNGYPLYIDYEIPAEEWPIDDVTISANGDIWTNEEELYLGRVVLFYPENLDTLTQLGEGRYFPSANVALYDSLENEDLFGQINQYFLESSNVDMTESFAEMITTQRAYSISAKAVQTTDEMMGIINNIKR
ncbi:MAG: flagellar hook-basal body protein [Tissierellia bacterium]|nr:flagellar hook-basal body protein [Tissierellia bacterium]